MKLNIILVCMIIPWSQIVSKSTECPCGMIPYPSNTGFVTPDPIVQSPEVYSFISESDLHLSVAKS